MIVSDASVIVSLVLPGHGGHSQAWKLLDAEARWIAPPLWRLELISSLLQYVRHGRYTADEAHEALTFAEGVVATSAIEPYKGTFDTALECRLSAYDAHYVELARSIGARLITLDQRLQKAAPDVAMSPEEFLKA
ncbi:MAG: putative nucleic acid-binding protein [Rhodothermales bacterium]